jgi:hypothetical protein
LLNSSSLTAAVCRKSAPLFKSEESTNSFTGRGKPAEEEEEEDGGWRFSSLE